MTIKLSAIRERLKKASPGPWEVWTSCSWRRIGIWNTLKTVVEPTKCPTDGHPDLYARYQEAMIR